MNINELANPLTLGTAVSLIIAGLVTAIIYFVKKDSKSQDTIKDLYQKISDLQDQRFQDQKDSAKVQAAPFVELQKFVSFMYEQYNDSHLRKN